jgi:hypothetical protein
LTWLTHEHRQLVFTQEYKKVQMIFVKRFFQDLEVPMDTWI